MIALWMAGPATAQDVGNVVAITGSAQIVAAGQRMPLEPDTAIAIGDRIETDATGRVSLLFIDDTKILVGPNARLTIDTVLMQNGGTARRFAVSAASGAFRFVSGKSEKSAYEIRTPTATMGIRGTTFDVAVNGRVGTDLALFRGEVLMFPRSGSGAARCAAVRGACAVAMQDPDGGFRAPETRAERNTVLNAAFPMVVSQRKIQRPFRAPVWTCGNIAAPILAEGSAITRTPPAPRATDTPATPNRPADPAPPPEPPSEPPPEPPPEPRGDFPGQSGTEGPSQGRGNAISQGQDGTGTGTGQGSTNRTDG